MHLDCGFDIDIGPLRRFCRDMNIDFHVEETNIIYCLDVEEEKNSCYLCGRLRRGTHGRVSKKLGVTKVVLEKEYPDIREKILTSLSNIDIKNIWKQRRDCW